MGRREVRREGGGVASELWAMSQLFMQHSVTQVCCGGQHAAILTESGHVYTWGRGERPTSLPPSLPPSLLFHALTVSMSAASRDFVRYFFIIMFMLFI